MLRGEHITQGQRRAVPPRGIPCVSIPPTGTRIGPFGDGRAGKEFPPPSFLDPEAPEFPLSKLMLPHPPAQESSGVSVGSNVVTVPGRERNTHPGHGPIFSNQIPGSKSNPSCLRWGFHPK